MLHAGGFLFYLRDNGIIEKEKGRFVSINIFYMKGLHMVTFTLLVIGGLNWLLVGVVGWDVSRWLGGMDSMLARTIYILVGVSAIVEIATHKSNCKMCNTSASM
ncbi:MAG: DUF378 domain-containing protein [Patescibacteria group bacterium]